MYICVVTGKTQSDSKIVNAWQASSFNTPLDRTAYSKENCFPHRCHTAISGGELPSGTLRSSSNTVVASTVYMRQLKRRSPNIIVSCTSGIALVPSSECFRTRLNNNCSGASSLEIKLYAVCLLTRRQRRQIRKARSRKPSALR